MAIAKGFFRCHSNPPPVLAELLSASEPFTIDIPIDRKEDVRRINFFYTYGTVEDFYRREFETTP